MKIYDYNGKKNMTGERIRLLRLKERMTQSDLAARLQVRGVEIDTNSVSRIESGNRFVADYELYVLSEIFHVGVEKFFTDLF